MERLSYGDFDDEQIDRLQDIGDHHYCESCFVNVPLAHTSCLDYYNHLRNEHVKERRSSAIFAGRMGPPLCADCPLIVCPNRCQLRMHSCKVEDHLAAICPNVIVSCINAEHGCRSHMQRQHISNHLKVCPANVIQCSFVATRACVIESEPEGRKALKSLARNSTQKAPSPSANHDLDIAVALKDQQLVIDHYTFSRAERRRKIRQQLNNMDPKRLSSDFRTLPHLPMFVDGVNRSPDPPKPDVDSSEDERKADEEKNKNKMSPTDPSMTCVICRAGNTEQHLHRLGNLSEYYRMLDEGRNKKPMKKKKPSVLPLFYKNYNLHLKTLANQVSTSDRSMLPKGAYRFCCNQLIKTTQIDAHMKSAHGEHFYFGIDNRLFKRCPMWWTEKACTATFPVYELYLNGERCMVKYNYFVDVPTIRQIYSSPATDQCDRLSDLVPDVQDQIVSLLDAASLYCLSATNRRWRYMCSRVLRDQGVVVRPWKKIVNGNSVSWQQTAPIHTFTKTVDLSRVQWRISSPATYIRHLQQCALEKQQLPEHATRYDVWPSRDTFSRAIPF